MTGIKSLVYDNIWTWFNIEASVHVHNIGRNVRSVNFVETVKNSTV